MDNNSNNDADLLVIETYITNTSYPISRSNLLQHAEDQGASREVMDVLRKIPDMEYQDIAEVQEALSRSQQDQK